MDKCDILRRVGLALVAFMLVGMTGVASADENKRQVKQPNILFIMADDHATQAIGVYGSRLAKLNPTPNIDALSKNGMRFDRVYCNNSICTPSRASIVTGQCSQANGVLMLDEPLPPARQYLPMEMKKLGYETAMIGKWHLADEPAAFDFYEVLPGQGQYFNPSFLIHGDEPWPKNRVKFNGYVSDIITDLGIDWLKHHDKSKPFFLMLHHKAPHDMFEFAPRYSNYLANVEMPEPGNLYNQPAEGFGSVASRELGAGVTRAHPSWGLGRRLGVNQSLPSPEYGRVTYQTYLKRYLRCVKGVDDNVKRLTDYLKETGELDNTIILYTSDQGLFLGEHDLIDKRWMYEEAFRMPFIVYAPKMVKAGSTNDWLINNTDFAPTILELAGASSTPSYMQGRSFAGALKGQAKPADWRTVTYYRYWMHMAHGLRVPAHFGVRDQRYKLIFFYGCNPDGSGPQTPVAWEFYDLDKDPFEMKNLYPNPEYKAIVEAMKVKLKTTREELNETDKNYPRIQAIIDAHWEDK